MTKDEDSAKLTIITSAPVAAPPPSATTLATVPTLGVDVPLSVLKRSLARVLENVSSMLENASSSVKKGSIEYVDIAVGVEADGTVGLLGNSVRAGATASLTIRLNLAKPQ